MLDHALIRKANSCLSDGWHCFGLEAKAAWLLQERLGANVPRKPFYRIAPEPILWSFWSELADLRLTAARALELASLLTGQRQSYRTKPIFGLDEHHRRFYFARRSAPNALEGYLEMARDTQPLEVALEALFRNIVFAHPFTDGNGRVARALIVGLLARHGLITLPCLPLNSVFETRKSPIASAFRTAIERGAQHLLQALLCAAVNEAAALACRAQSAEAAAHSGGLLHLSDRQIPPHQD